jgi:hypothetical protein
MTFDEQENLFSTIQKGDTLVFENWNITTDYTKYKGIADNLVVPKKAGVCPIWFCKVEGYGENLPCTWPMLLEVIKNDK